MTEPHPSDDLIARVLAGEATAEEAAAVERWAAADPSHRTSLARLREAWTARASSGDWDVDRAWARVSVQVESGEHDVDVISIPRASSPFTTAWRIAAALLVVVGAVFAWRTLGGTGTTFATAAGEVRQVALDDGTAVILAPLSRLEVPSRFARNRTVTLEGEAWFDIATAGGPSFTVRAGGYQVRDIGTSFTVRTRHADSLAVVVVDGIVLVTHGSATTDTLHAGTAAEFTAGEPAAIRVVPDAAARAAWRSGALEFTAVPASRVAARLAEWHGTTIRIADARLADRPLTVTLPTDDLAEALDVLALLLGVSIERSDGVIVMR